MVEAEFVIASRLDHLFNASSKQYYVKDVLSKQSITVEALQLKRSMYNDVEGFVFTHFDLYCNLIRKFSEFDDSLKISTFRVLSQVAEKMVNLLCSVLDEGEDIEPEAAFKYRNMLKMTVYILCQFAQAYENENMKKTAAANIGKGRKKKLYADDSDSSEWPDERLKYLVVLKKIFQLPIRKLWNPPVVEYEFINFVTNAFFKMLENVEVSKDKAIKIEVFKFLGAVLIENTTGLAYSIKILQMVQDFEHLSNVMAEAVVYLMTECSADTLISEICREATLMDVKNLVQNLTAAHSLAQFLTSVCEKCPEKVACVVGSLLQFLEMESHVMRNCILSIIGTLLVKLFCNENMTPKDKKTREELLDHLEAHVLDVNSFVRSKAIQILKSLMEERALSSGELYQIGELISGRLKDKASNVRKNAMSFMALFVDVNQFACQVPLVVLKESYQVEMDKLKTLKKSKPVIFEDSDDEEPKEDGNKGLIFDDSDDDEENEEEEGEKTSSKDENEEKGNDSSDKMEGVTEEEPKEGSNEKSEEDAYAKQEKVVSYLKNTLNFAEVIHQVVEPVCQMLRSSTQTDVIEAVEFFTAAASNMLKGTDSGIKEVLGLVWSQETAIKNAALNSFKTLCLSTSGSNNVADITRNLLNLLKDATSDDVVNIQALVQHFCKSKDIPSTVTKVLWSNFRNLGPEKTEEKISNLLLLTMVAEVYPEFVFNKVDEIISYGLEVDGEKNYFIAKHIFKVLMCCNARERGKYDSAHASVSEYRFPLDHILSERFRSLLLKGITNFNDNQWAPMASDAVQAIFCLITDPVALCSEISMQLSEMVHGCFSSDSEENFNIPNNLLSRYLSFCGSVALHYTTYLKVDYFAHLRREEVQRELRRRKSTAHGGFSTPKSAMKTPKTGRKTPKSPKSSKKRQSISKTYKLVPPIDEETTYENIIEKCAKEVQSGQGLTGSLLPIVVNACHCTLRDFNKDIQAAASVALTKFMLISEKVCEDYMQLYATITEKSPEAYIRANMLVAMGDLTTMYPNVVEPWTPQIYQRLSDTDASVREAAIITLTHLILHDFVRVKSLISEAAKCIADPEPRVSEVAKYLFTELSKKGNIIYNIIPGIISSLSDPKAEFSEENFQVVLKHILQFIEKEKLVEGLVEKLCYRFTDSSSDIQLHELTFCLSILTLNDKCYSKLIEFKNLLRERMSDPIIMKYITNITANAKKNDAKTAAELETFRKELGI